MPSRPVKLTAEQLATAPRCPTCARRLRTDTDVYPQPFGEPPPKIGDTLTFGSFYVRTVTVQAIGPTWTEPEHMTKRKQYTAVWGGDWRQPYGEFDTLRCALKFARACYAAGMRMQKPQQPDADTAKRRAAKKET